MMARPPLAFTQSYQELELYIMCGLILSRIAHLTTVTNKKIGIIKMSSYIFFPIVTEAFVTPTLILEFVMAIFPF